MCLSAAMRRPLRSKRAMISPVRRRANASGLTRISVRSIAQISSWSDGGPSGFGAQPRLARHLTQLGLAIRAELPAGIQRAGAARARIAQLAPAVRTAQKVLLDLNVAMRAQHVVELVQ